MARLTQWDCDGPITAEAYSRLKADPAFPRAARALARNMLAASADDRTLDGVFKDAGRYVAALSAISLHVTGGLTLPRLKALCVAFGFSSAGRARALLIYLLYLGYVELFPARRRGSPARYLPTGRFVSAWRRHLRAALEAAAVVEPAVWQVLERLDEPDTFNAVVRIQSEGLLREARAADPDLAVSRVLLHRHAGIQLVWLILSAPEEAFPPRRPVPVSLANAARRFSVSRVHLRRLLEEARNAGLLRCLDDGTIVLEDKGRAEIEFLYANQIIRLLIVAAKTLDEQPELAIGRAPTLLTEIAGPDGNSD
jgi:hypothetical protein